MLLNVKKNCYSLKYLDLSNFNANKILLKTDCFLINIKDVIIKYNSSIFENIKNFIPNDGTNFIDVERYNGAFETKYIINDLNKKIKIINIPIDKINISVFVNNTKIIDLKENETEIFFW